MTLSNTDPKPNMQAEVGTSQIFSCITLGTFNIFSHVQIYRLFTVFKSRKYLRGAYVKLTDYESAARGSNHRTVGMQTSQLLILPFWLVEKWVKLWYELSTNQLQILFKLSRLISPAHTSGQRPMTCDLSSIHQSQHRHSGWRGRRWSACQLAKERKKRERTH